MLIWIRNVAWQAKMKSAWQKIALHKLHTCISAVIFKPFLLLTKPLLLCVVSNIECEMILKKVS